MLMVTLRMSDDEKEAWVEQAGGARKLSEWIRERCNGTLAERDKQDRSTQTYHGLSEPSASVQASVPVESESHGARTLQASDSARSASVPERPFRPDFKKPKQTSARRR